MLKGTVLLLQIQMKYYYLVVVGTTLHSKYFLLFKKKYPVDFDDELKIGDVRYDDMT